MVTSATVDVTGQYITATFDAAAPLADFVAAGSNFLDAATTQAYAPSTQAGPNAIIFDAGGPVSPSPVGDPWIWQVSAVPPGFDGSQTGTIT